VAQERLPKPVQDFRKRYPEVWKAFNELGDRCHAAGPLDEKTRRLVKVALSMGAGLEGATHSAVRNARRAGITLDEIKHVGVLAVSTLGLPAAMRALTWANERSRGIKP
jgi:4-carboxymuconolactone decarboxylase